MIGVEVDNFTPGWRAIPRVLASRYDIFHIHWLELAFWRVGKLATVKAVMVTLLAGAIVKLRRGAIVWTAHDPVPHQMHGNTFTAGGFFSLLWKVYAGALTRMLDGIILLSIAHRNLLNETRACLEKLPFVVTPHPHFKGVYANDVSRDEARKHLGLPLDATILLLLGTLRPYKNAEGLIESFRQLPGEDLRLVIAGKPDSEAYGAALRILAQGDGRIIFTFEFFADEDLQLFLNAADGMVIPFRKATNSGSVLLSLSFARPVAVPDIPVFRELRDGVGNLWIRLMPSSLTPTVLQDIVEWIGQPRPTEPDLDQFDWPQIADRTVSFFRQLQRH
jgi:glycosyltransferase involved in cell wall biosynthesis